jgi:hypothetical protein
MWKQTSGGGGGSGTVQTDGVTLQGDGSGGNKIRILQVETDATLTGAGTVASPLSVVNTPVPFWTNHAQDTSVGSLVANQLALQGHVIEYPLTATNLIIAISTGDAGGLYDIAIYNPAGTRLGHVGAQAMPTTGIQSFAIIGGPISLARGLYYFGITGNSTVMQFNFNVAIVALFNASYVATVGGVCPASIAAPTVTPNSVQIAFAVS